MIKGLEDNILFDEEAHSYVNKITGASYLPVSNFISLFQKDVNWGMIAKKIATRDGVQASDVTNDWKRRADNGTRIHKGIERFEKTTVILPEDLDIKQIIATVASYYTDYYRIYQEQRLSCDEYMICGTTDKVGVCTSSSKSVIDIHDYKTKEDKLVKYKSDNNTYMLHCLSHLQDCTFNRYALQLSIYAYLLQKKTGRKIGELAIIEIPTNDHTKIRKIYVPYMKYEVEAMLNWYKENILDKKPGDIIFDESIIFGEE